MAIFEDDLTDVIVDVVAGDIHNVQILFFLLCLVALENLLSSLGTRAERWQFFDCDLVVVLLFHDD